MAYRMGLAMPGAGYVEVMEVDSRRHIRMTSQSSGSTALAFSRDGKYMALGAGFVYVYELATGMLISIPTGSSGTVNDMMFSPDGTRLAIAISVTPFLIVYDTATWSILSGSNAPTVPSTNGRSCAFSPDSATLAYLTSSSPYFHLYNVADMSRIMPSLVGPATASTSGGSLRYSPDGTKLAIGGTSSPYVTVYDTATWTKLTVAGLPAGAIYDVAWSPDGQSLAAVGNVTPYVFVWNTATWARRTLPGAVLTTSVVACAFTPDSKTLVCVLSNFFSTTGGLISYDTTTWQRGSAELLSPNVRLYSDVQFQADPPRFVRGTVRNISGNPVARKVRAYLRSTGDIIGETMSNATTGDYEIPIYRAESELVDIQFLTAEGELLNDLFFARASTSAT